MLVGWLKENKLFGGEKISVVIEHGNYVFFRNETKYIFVSKFELQKWAKRNKFIWRERK